MYNFSLRYPACNAYATYCHLWPATLQKSVPRYLIKGMIFEKKVSEHKTYFLGSTQHETFFILTRIERDKVKYVYWSS
jgi:hypothetical protein